LADYRGAFNYSVYPVAWGGVISPLFVLAVAVGLFVLRKRWPEGALGLGWVLVALLPVSHLIDFHYPVAEHYLYFPCVGFALVLASGVEKIREGSRGWGTVLFLCLILVYSVSTVVRNSAWQDMESMTLDILAKAPDHPRAQSTLVHLYAEENRYEEALALGERMPESAVNHFNLGVLYEKTGDFPKAEKHYVQAILLQRTLWDAYLNLGNLLLIAGQERRGHLILEQLVQSYGYHPLLYGVLGEEAGRKGHWDEALPLFLKGVALNPKSGDAYFAAAVALGKAGRQQESEEMLVHAAEYPLDIDWLSNQEPWASLLATPDGRLMIETIQKMKE
jgi:Flp pilus assembly protein TadD